MRLRNIKGAHDIISSSRYFTMKNDFKDDKPLEIEIGMGKGDFIITKAIKNPDINYIGIDAYASVLVSAIKKLENYDLPNLKIMNINANEINGYFNKNVSKVYLNFSDPWPKKRHSDRRLTSTIFLNKYNSIFKDEHVIEIKTDNRNLFEYSLVSLSKNNYILNEVSLDLYSNLNDDNIATEYENKFVQMGLPIYKLVARQSVDNKKIK